MIRPRRSGLPPHRPELHDLSRREQGRRRRRARSQPHRPDSPPDYIILSILVPDQSIKEQYQTLVVLTNDGQVYQGIVTDKDNQRIVLKEATGALRVVPVNSIEDQKAAAP